MWTSFVIPCVQSIKELGHRIQIVTFIYDSIFEFYFRIVTIHQGTRKKINAIEKPNVIQEENDQTVLKSQQQLEKEAI